MNSSAVSKLTTKSVRCSSLEEVIEWHTAPWVRGEAPILAKDIIVDRPVTLSQTPKMKEIGAIEHSIRIAAQGETSKSSSRISTPSDADHQEVTASSLLTEQEIEPAVLEVQALSAEEQTDSSPQKSRGVPITLGATAFAVGGLLLLQKLYKIRKRKP